MNVKSQQLRRFAATVHAEIASDPPMPSALVSRVPKQTPAGQCFRAHPEIRNMDIPVIEQVKIQARVLVPLVKALQAELGEARANALVRRALGHVYRRLGAKWWQAKGSKNLGENMAAAFAKFAGGDALDFRVREQSQDAFEIDVTECRYAQFYKELGEPELGFLLACSSDFTFAEGFGPDVKLTRTQTIMQGASHCDFRYQRRKA